VRFKLTHFINHFLRVLQGGILGKAKLYYSVLESSRNQLQKSAYNF